MMRVADQFIIMIYLCSDCRLSSQKRTRPPTAHFPTLLFSIFTPFLRLAGAPWQNSPLKFEVLILSPRVGLNLPSIISHDHHVSLKTRRVATLWKHYRPPFAISSVNVILSIINYFYYLFEGGVTIRNIENHAMRVWRTRAEQWNNSPLPCKGVPGMQAVTRGRGGG